MKLIIFLALIVISVQAHPPIAIVMDMEGNIFYSDLVNVLKIDKKGSKSIAVEDVHTHNLYLDDFGNLYGEHEWYEGEETDIWRNYVWKLSKDGAFSKLISSSDGMLDNNTLVRDSKGNSFWAKKVDNHEILMIESKDKISRAFLNHEFDDIRWIYYSKHDENIYVVDKLKVKVIDKNGKLIFTSNSLKTEGKAFEGVGDHHYVYGVWTDPKGNFYIAVFGAKQIIKFNKERKPEVLYKSKDNWSPCGGVSDQEGNIWILEFSDNNETRVRRFDG